MVIRPIRAIAYARLSREDIRGTETPEEKIQARVQICRNLAAQNGLPLAESDIICEYGTGTSIAKRPGIQLLLQHVESGQYSHVITPYQSRLTRGDGRDRATIKEVFCLAQITLVTTERSMVFNEDFWRREGLMFDMKGVVDEHFVQDAVHMRMEADLIAMKAGKNTRGTAVYGYRWLRPVHDAYGRLAEPGRYEVIPEEYAIVKEIFERLGIDTVPDIAIDLNRRGVPPPGASRPGQKGSRWHESSIYLMIRTPFYAGYLSQRQKVVHGKHGTTRKVRLRPDQYILSDVKGDWPTPISLDQYYANCGRIEHINRRPARSGLLTGIVYCPHGAPMVIQSHANYGCGCRLAGNAHVGRLCSSERLEEWARGIVDAVMTALPDDALPRLRAKTDRPAILAQLAKARKGLSDKQQQAQDVILREAYFVSLMGRDTYEQTARKTAEELEELRELVAGLEQDAAVPDAEQALTLVQAIRSAGGMEHFWQETTHQEHRVVVEGIIKRIDMASPRVRYYTDASVTLWEWAAAYNPRIPLFPKSKRKGNISNLLRGKQRR